MTTSDVSGRPAVADGPSPTDKSLVRRCRLGDEGAEIAAVAARDQHHLGRRAGLSQPRGNREAVHTRKLDVDQRDVRAEPRHLVDRRLSVGSLPHHVEPLCLEHGAGLGAEPRVVGDDHDGWALGHGLIVAYAPHFRRYG